jgi:2-oxoglutarate ferredoxin oxidoreductase subunit delta
MKKKDPFVTETLGEFYRGLDEYRKKNLEDPRKHPLWIFSRWCKGCRICVELCPTDALEMSSEQRAFLAHPEACTRCGICEINCPDFAITLGDIAPERTRKVRAEVDENQEGAEK